MEEGRWKREIRIETSEKEGAITETGNRRMLAGRDLYRIMAPRSRPGVRRHIYPGR